jgi:hypothetical protein
MQHVQYSNVVNNCYDIYVHESFCCQAETSRANDANHSSVRGWRLKAFWGVPLFYLYHMVTREQSENVQGLRSTPRCPSCFLLRGAVQLSRGTSCRMPQALAAFWKHAARGWRCRNARPVAIISRHSHRCRHPRQIPISELGIILCILGSLRRSA